MLVAIVKSTLVLLMKERWRKDFQESAFDLSLILLNISFWMPTYFCVNASVRSCVYAVMNYKKILKSANKSPSYLFVHRFTGLYNAFKLYALGKNTHKKRELSTYFNFRMSIPCRGSFMISLINIFGLFLSSNK